MAAVSYLLHCSALWCFCWETVQRSLWSGSMWSYYLRRHWGYASFNSISRCRVAETWGRSGQVRHISSQWSLMYNYHLKWVLSRNGFTWLTTWFLRCSGYGLCRLQLFMCGRFIWDRPVRLRKSINYGKHSGVDQHLTYDSHLDQRADCVWWISLALVLTSVCFSGRVNIEGHSQVGVRLSYIEQRNCHLQVEKPR